MSIPGIYRRIRDLLNAGNLSELFRGTLHWGAPRGLQPRSLRLGAPTDLAVEARPIAQLSDLPVFRVDWPSERPPGIAARRAVQRALKPFHAEHLVCYVAAGGKQLAFTWARRRRSDGKTELRTLTYEIGLPARTTIERLAELAFGLDELGYGEPSIATLTDRLDRAFSVEAVTEQFFQDYKKVFGSLQDRLLTLSNDVTWAHDYALQLLNRVMFIYFIQRKGWVGNDPTFLVNFWKAYKASHQPNNSFYEQWLSVLFFEAFNNKSLGGYHHFPKTVSEVLQLAPYLNGGLFFRNKLDDKYNVVLPDDLFSMLFDEFGGSTPGFFERYNFTIFETAPLDIEVAVDPEMIGKVYESLVNITSEGLSEADLRGSAGIFYTPRVEIDLMCRLSLVDALANHLGQDVRGLLYDLVFALEPEEKEAADRALAERGLWPELNRVLRELTVCDPACGSGSFLVGMLLVLDDLQARAAAQLGIEETPYQRRRRIIGDQLYGVDVMNWAVHVAELRLWLQLVVETDLEPAELKLRPLLPNLSFNLRCGDSLVQDIGGINFGLPRAALDIPPHLKGRMTQLKGKKRRYYQGAHDFSEDALKHEEQQLFREILEHRIFSLKQEIGRLTHSLRSMGQQASMEWREPGKAEKALQEQTTRWQKELEEKEAELSLAKKAHAALAETKSVPFVWDIAFVDVFEKDHRGFDIVIGNPPYVRQEQIAPPWVHPSYFGGEASEEWKRRKLDYKAALQESVAAAWPKFFRYKPGRTDFRKLDGKSDLYIYFYLHGLSLMNRHGSFCFITSNSWLDVGYGKDLQELLLRHGHVKFILDNEKKRSFAQADVNTIIVLLGRPDDRHERGLDKTARFVMFKVPFEEVLSAETFKALEAATERQATHRWRVTVVSQRELLEEGMAQPEDEQPPPSGDVRRGPLIKVARYLGNKWGGKYLRAPDIFFTIMAKGKGKLVRLGDIAEVRRGFTTGANDFFYLEPTGEAAPAGYLHVRNAAGWEGVVEERFLKPVIKSPRECRTIVIRPEDLRYKILMCHENREALKGTAALEYIAWGESQGYDRRPSCRGRPRWWDVGTRDPARININYLVGEVMRFFMKEDGFYVSDNFQEWHVPEYSVWQETLFANSTVFQLLANIEGRANFGGGLLKVQTYEVARMQSLDPGALPLNECRNVLMGVGRGDLNSSDRRVLDNVVFDVLGLTKGEREAVYEAVIELVSARLQKARSL